MDNWDISGLNTRKNKENSQIYKPIFIIPDKYIIIYRQPSSVDFWKQSHVTVTLHT